MEKDGIYIYGIVPNIYHSDIFKSLEEIGVYSITYQNVAAIVSDRAFDSVDFSNRESLGYLLVEHQETIEELSKKGLTVILPMRLGIIVKSKENVIEILSTGYQLITETLKKVEDLTEMDLVITWADFATHINEIVLHEDIQNLKQEILSKNNVALQQVDQVKIGMLIQEKISEQNKRIELKTLNDLSLVTENIKIHEVMNDQMISNAAFLIHKDKLEMFGKIVDQIDEEFNGKLNFKLAGTLPNYSFYTIDIKELNASLIVEAKELLELETISNEKEIKNAYLNKAKLVHPDMQLNNSEDEFNKFNEAYHLLLKYNQAYKCYSLNNNNHHLNINEIKNLILVTIKE